MDRKIMGVGIGAVFVLIVASMFGAVMAHDNSLEEERVDDRVNCPMHNDLTEEQKEIISDKIIELREQGASLEEMKAEMQELFEEQGIEHNIGNCERHRTRDRVDSEDREFQQHRVNCPMH